MVPVPPYFFIQVRKMQCNCGRYDPTCRGCKINWARMRRMQRQVYSRSKWQANRIRAGITKRDRLARQAVQMKKWRLIRQANAKAKWQAGYNRRSARWPTNKGYTPNAKYAYGKNKPPDKWATQRRLARARKAKAAWFAKRNAAAGAWADQMILG